MIMGKHTTIRLENQQIQAAELMEKTGDADTQSEAIRQFINTGMAEMGYGNGKPPESTTLQRLTRESARALTYVGLGWVVLAWMLPVVFRLPAVGVLLAAGGLWGLDRVLDEHEPAVSQRLPLIGGGEKA